MSDLRKGRLVQQPDALLMLRLISNASNLPATQGIVECQIKLTRSNGRKDLSEVKHDTNREVRIDVLLAKRGNC